MTIALRAAGAGSSGASVVARRPETFGAKRDGRDVWDGAMTNGSAVLTSALGLFEPTIAGKSINVAGAGAAGGTLLTTVLSRQSATQVTLNTASSATISGKQALWGTDDTQAVRDALDDGYDACVTDRTNLMILDGSAGIYCLGSATVMGGDTRGNAQVPFPNREPTAGHQVVIVLRGPGWAGSHNHWLQTVAQRSGCVYRSMLVGQTPYATRKSPSVFGGPTVTLTGGGEFSNIHLVTDNVTIMAPVNPSVIGLDARRLAKWDWTATTFLADGLPSQLLAPTNDNGIGCYAPMINNNDSVTGHKLNVAGFYYSVGCSDHFACHSLTTLYYNTAMYINAPPATYVHGIYVGMWSSEAGATIIEKSNDTGDHMPITVSRLDTETQTGTVFKDPASNLHGIINYASNDGADPTVTGCANLRINNVNRVRGNITAPSVPATTVASTPIFRDAAVTIAGGTVTAVAVDGVATGLTSGTFIVPTGKTITLTYSSVPTWKWTLL